MNLKILWSDSRIHVGFTLLLVWLLTLWHFRADTNLLRLLLNPLLAFATVAVVDLGLTYFRFRKYYLPTAAVVSGFLIGLILAPTEPIYVIVTASILASLSKQFIALGIRQHMFNPAAFGIMSVYFIFGTTVSWWGIAWGLYPLIIIVPLMIRILWKLKRLFLPISFLVIYSIYLFIVVSSQFALRILIDPTVLLFALVMLPEPITSPNTGYFKYVFGGFVAILSILASSFTNLSEIFLPSLLLANIVSFFLPKVNRFNKRVVGLNK